MNVSEKYYDEIFHFKGQWDVPSACGLKIIPKPAGLDLPGKTVVIVTELYQDNPGTSVTYAARSLADQICQAKGLDSNAIVYLECNPDTNSKLSFYDEAYFEVTFSSITAAAPAYRQLAAAEVRALFGAEQAGAVLPARYTLDRIRAVDAKFEAQKIAFAPLTFQAIRALLELGILQKISDAGDAGLTREEAAEAAGVSVYGVGVLGEIALGMNVLKLRLGAEGEERFVLGKIGWFLLEDDMTRVNFNFANDICYQGAFDLTESARTGTPRGLRVFGEQWRTIYEALSSLPERAKKSWFAFDHFYSDIAFPEALPLVFATPPHRLFDIGGNTAKWAIKCCAYDPAVQVTIIDLPGQTAVAEKNAADAGFGDRIAPYPCDALDPAAPFPPGADAIWMSQFLDCFSLDQVTAILRKIHAAVTGDAAIWVLEPLWDMQKFDAAAYSLQATSLYFTCMANGNSKMYRFAELTGAIEKAGFELSCAHHGLGSNSYSLLRFRKKT
jgi:hypothetical protein